MKLRRWRFVVAVSVVHVLQAYPSNASALRRFTIIAIKPAPRPGSALIYKNIIMFNSLQAGV
jgi:hypothetical protein